MNIRVEPITYDDEPGVEVKMGADKGGAGNIYILHLAEAQHLRNRLNSVIGDIKNPQQKETT